MTVSVRPARTDEAPWIEDEIRRRWGSDVVVSRGLVHRPAGLPGFVAEEDGAPVGLLTYHVGEAGCEIVTIDAFESRRGIGRALVEAVRTLGHPRLWLATTNDNVVAQRFYERLGFRLAAVHHGAVARSRELKPEIRELAPDGTPIRDELEYEWRPGLGPS